MKNSIGTIFIRVIIIAAIFLILLTYFKGGYEFSLFSAIGEKLTEAQKCIYEIIGGIIIILYIVYFLIKGKKPRIKNYRRDWNEIVPPAIAEIIIDGKIELKRLVMATIADLITRGNIQVINDECIRIKNLKGLEFYERLIIEIVLPQNKTVYFKDLKEIFKQDNEKAKYVYNTILQVKEEIIRIIEEKKIIDKSKNKYLNILRHGAVVIIIDIIFVMIFDAMGFIYGFLASIAIFLAYYNTRSRDDSVSILDKIKKFNEEWTSVGKIALLVLLVYSIYVGSILVPKSIILIAIGLIYIVILAILIKFTKVNIFSNIGKQEQIKVIEVKNYIKEYSMMEDRNLKEIIIWDKYLAYAIAFGIPTKITDKVYEGWLQTNIFLQAMDNILTI